MTADKDEALRLADALDKWQRINGIPELAGAAELVREQHAEIERLRADVQRLRGAIEKHLDPAWQCNSDHPALRAALAADAGQAAEGAPAQGGERTR